MSSFLHFLLFFFFFNDTATPEIYTLSLHDALPISANTRAPRSSAWNMSREAAWPRSEEHTSELQSQFHLVCRLLLEKKNTNQAARRQKNRQKRDHLHRRQCGD